MIKSDPCELVETLLHRSTCSVKVASAIADSYGVFSWGWNSAGAGFGEHAEAAAIRRANRKRLKGSTIYVAAVRGRNSKSITAKPCADCQRLIYKYNMTVCYRIGPTWIIL